MDSDIRIKRSVLSLFMALVLIFSTQAQISAPAMSSDRENAQSVSIVPFVKQTEKLQESVSADPAQNVSDASDEIVHNYGSTGDISSPAGRATSFTDDILSSVNDEITVIENDGQKENTEREGVTIVPADVNNVIRDSLPSIFSTKIYTFTVDERGVIVYAFNHINKTERDCMWYLTLYEEYSADGSGGNIAYREINRAVYSSIGTTVMSPELGVLPGNYRLAVECISGFSSDKYDLLIGFAGDDSFEIECNNTQSRYTHLPLGKTISGSASSFSDGTADVDWYMFEITEKGYAVLYFDHDIDTTAAIDSVAWRIQLIDEAGNEYFKTNSTMTTEMLNSGIMGLQPGYYFVSVSSQVFTAVTYSLNVSFTKDNSIERELNETPETATPVSVNTEIVGSLTERDAVSDRDYYSFIMENDGFIVIDFVHEALSEQRDGWNITVTAEDGRLVYSDVSDWSQATLQSPNLGLTAGKYYIKIDSDSLYLSSIVYRLILSTNLDDTWESEPNNTPETADELILGTPISGTLVETGVNYDRDYFRLTAEAGKINITFSHIKYEEANKVGWIVSLLDKNGNTIVSADSYWDSDEITLTADVESGDYYILIETGLFFNNSRYIFTAEQPSN